MAEVTNELIFETLKRIQAELGAMKGDLAVLKTELKADIALTRGDISKQVALLADGLLSLRRDVQTMTSSVDILTISTSGHAERLADIERHLGVATQPNKFLPCRGKETTSAIL